MIFFLLDCQIFNIFLCSFQGLNSKCLIRRALKIISKNSLIHVIQEGYKQNKSLNLQLLPLDGKTRNVSIFSLPLPIVPPRAFFCPLFLASLVPRKTRYPETRLLPRILKVGTHWVTSCSNTLHRHVAATNRSVCTGDFCENICPPATEFCRRNKSHKIKQTEFVRLVAC